MNYLSRYVFRMAVTNHRIVDVTETEVTFRYKDRKTNTMQTETVTGVEFLRRFLIHVLPKGFLPLPIEISRVRVRLPLLRVAAKLLPSTGSMTDCLRQGGLPQSIVADFSIGIDHKVRYYGLWQPSKRTLQMAARVLLIFRKPTGKEMPLLTSEIIPHDTPVDCVKRYGECCPKCGSDRVQMIAESKRISIPYEHIRLGMFDWLEAMTRGQPQGIG